MTSSSDTAIQNLKKVPKLYKLTGGRRWSDDKRKWGYIRGRQFSRKSARIPDDKLDEVSQIHALRMLAWSMMNRKKKQLLNKQVAIASGDRQGFWNGKQAECHKQRMCSCWQGVFWNGRQLELNMIAERSQIIKHPEWMRWWNCTVSNISTVASMSEKKATKGYRKKKLSFLKNFKDYSILDLCNN